MSFEQDFNRLQEIVKRLDQGELSLEKSLELFEEGIKLFRRCQVDLNKAEDRISQLVKSVDQELKIVPFDLTGGRGERD